MSQDRGGSHPLAWSSCAIPLTRITIWARHLPRNHARAAARPLPPAPGRGILSPSRTDAAMHRSKLLPLLATLLGLGATLLPGAAGAAGAHDKLQCAGCHAKKEIMAGNQTYLD